LQLIQRIKKRLFRPRVLSGLVTSGSRAPRSRDAFVEQGQSQVYRIVSEGDVQELFQKINALWDNAWGNLFQPEHRILIKINLNTSDPYPASTSPEMLAELVDLLRARGLRRIKVGDCSWNGALPTRNVARQAGITGAVAGKAKMVFFDEGSWVTVPLPGTFLKKVTVPEIALNVDRIIFLANLKTHFLADFTFGLKLAVGFMHPLERSLLHQERLREKVVEINLAVPADLTIIDGRTAFVSGGPARGRAEKAGLVLAGTNPLAVDVEAYRQLYNLKKQHQLEESFSADPFQMIQLSHARECGLGGETWPGYTCVDL
jgi:uncharacterized protein (DUF362 family)